MKAKSILIAVTLIFGVCITAISQQPKQEVYVAPNAPKDKPVGVGDSEVQQLEAAIKPYIEKARTTYPQARARFLKGLPAKHTFFITTRLHDSSKRFEQVFIAVNEIKDGRISGVIASQIRLVSGYQEGDSYSFPESELIDWTISKPDGTEEGNFVGNFLDTYKPGHYMEASVWKNEPPMPVRMNQQIEEGAVKYAAYAPIPRIVFYDIGYPENGHEYAALDGNSVILFTAISQDRGELPLKKAYVLLEGKEIELKLLRVGLSEMPVNDSAAAKTFGRFRADALYLFPMSLRVKNGDLLIDFQKNRMAFKVATLGTPLSDELSRMMLIKLSGTGPLQSALQEFIKREYPGFFQN